MGCDIHLITEIRKDGRWKYVPEVPTSICNSGYKVYAAIAGVRDAFGNCIFEPKGLPKDISGKRFRWISHRGAYERNFREVNMVVFVKADGSATTEHPKAVEIDSITYKKVKEGLDADDPEIERRYHFAYWSETGSERRYFVCDAYAEGGHYEIKKPFEFYKSLDEYMKQCYSENWDEDAQDYGHWQIDFDCQDFHTPSYISLSEFKKADYSRYTAIKYKMDKDFYDAFVAAGGTFPSKFTIVEKPAINDFAAEIREAYEPTVTIMWQPDKFDKSESMLFKGIDELKEIALKYSVEPDDIRIVFAFDN